MDGPIYGKFNVSRVDGRDQPGGDKQGADYFVLDVTHDPAAIFGVIGYMRGLRDMASTGFKYYPELYNSLADKYVSGYAVAPYPSLLEFVEADLAFNYGTT